MWNARLKHSQDGVKIARRNSNNFKYADDTTLMAESEEELKSLLMRVKKERERAGLKLHIKNNYFCFIDYTKVFVDHSKLWKIVKRWECQTILPASWETCR